MYPLIYISETVFFPTYLVIISFLYTFGTFWIFTRSLAQGLSSAVAMDITIAIMIGGLAGARLLHVLFEFPSFYLENPVEIFKIWNGGFVFYGGLVGGFASAFAVVRYKKENPYAWMDVFAPVVALGYGLGRLGCLFAGCCYGTECDLPWAIQYPAELGSPPAGVLRHPIPIYDLILSVVIFLILLGMEKLRKHLPQWLKPSGSLFFVWIILFSLQRIVMEDLRDDFRGPAILGFTISTLLSLTILISAIGILLKRRSRAEVL